MTDDQLSRLERLTQLYKEGTLSDSEFSRQKANIIASAPGNAQQVPRGVSSQPSTARPVAQAPKKTNWLGWVLGILFGTIVLNLIIPSNKSETGITDSSATAADSASGAAEPTAPAAPASRWSYYDSADKMGSKYFTASIDANDLLTFDFPYNGGSVATLTIRRKRGETDLFLKVSKGQFINKSDEGSARVKFDNGAPRAYSITEAADYSSDIIFFDSASKLVSKMKKSKKMIIEAEFYQEAKRQIEFDISGLKWSH